MNRRMKGKIAIDVIMTVLLLFLMARQITGESAHEWLGAAMFVLWIAHHVLNRNWYGRLFKGKYTALRIFQTALNFAVLLSMAGMMISGIILSREVFAFLPVSGGVAMARQMHICSAFWGFVLMALHLGIHWNMIIGMVRKITGPVFSGPLRICLRLAAALIAAYGLYAFLKNQFLSYMFLTTHFVFFDFERPVLLFFTEYLAIMGLFVFLACYISRGIQKRKENGRRKIIDRNGCP